MIRFITSNTKIHTEYAFEHLNLISCLSGCSFLFIHQLIKIVKSERDNKKVFVAYGVAIYGIR